ncbi:MAG: MFS transporter [Holosporaceae bacterium]|jgi:PAT family beta-lactamase induction signal transducer AmpG|nr:MFS transporter [Holosporaceae bacterium]
MKLASIVDDFVNTYIRAGIGARFSIGFTCGIPFLLRLTVLDLWLKECGVSNTIIGLFTLLQWPFALKFLWAPFIEKTDFPILSKAFGRRRGWAIASQLLLFIGLAGMATATPQTSIANLMFYVSVVAFADGCQDMSLYAYQLDKANAEMFGPIAGIFVFGYKTGMFFSKSITLYLAYYFGWNFAYISMAFSIFLCTIFIFCAQEPEIKKTNGMNRIEKMLESFDKNNRSRFEFIYLIKVTIFECLVCPFKIFMRRKDWLWTILLIVLYRAGDRIAQKMAKPFYLDIGFSILDIANVVQVFGTIAALIGGILGGYWVKKLGIKRAMFLAGIVHAIGCLAYLALAYIGHNIIALYLTVFIENITNGAITTAFIAFLYSLCNKDYATTQYALLWAFYEFGGTICRTISGLIADYLGWINFFLLIPILFVPSLIILHNMISKEKNVLSTT